MLAKYEYIVCNVRVQGKLTAQGRLLFQDMVLVAELGGGLAAVGGAMRPRFKQWRVFLFEQLLIMAEEMGFGAAGAPEGAGGRRANQSSAAGAMAATLYIYKASVKVNKIQLIESFDPAAPLGSPDLHGMHRDSDTVGM